MNLLSRPTFSLGIVALLSGLVIAQSPDVGERAIDFELPVVGTVELLKLSDEYKQGPVAVIVLRGFPGYQCPLCSRQVSSLINRAGKLAEAAQRVILVYPGPATALESHAEEFISGKTLRKPMILVRDEDMKMVTKWGLRWNAPRETAYPATFVIDQQGKITWKSVSDSHGGRTTTEQVLAALRKS